MCAPRRRSTLSMTCWAIALVAAVTACLIQGEVARTACWIAYAAAMLTNLVEQRRLRR